MAHTVHHLPDITHHHSSQQWHQPLQVVEQEQRHFSLCLIRIDSFGFKGVMSEPDYVLTRIWRLPVFVLFISWLLIYLCSINPDIDVWDI